MKDPMVVSRARQRATPKEAVSMILQPESRRQLGEEGLFVLWRDSPSLERREGLACILSMCPHPKCSCLDVHVDGFVLDAQAGSVFWDDEGVHVTGTSDAPSARFALEEKLIAIVDPASGEAWAHPDVPDVADPDLLAWLVSEMDGELLDVLHRFRPRAKGCPPEQPRTDIDLDAVEEFHLAAFDDLFEGVRLDEYLLGGHRYWTAMFLCPYADCDCRQLRVAFFDAGETEPGDSVGSVLVDLGGAEGFKVVRMVAECGAPDHLVRDLWASFERRHNVGPYFRRREAQAKAVGATLWHPVAQPARAAPKVGRNDPCPCGSGVKFKKCCLGKEPSSST
jgi:hypothetical protein